MSQDRAVFYFDPHVLVIARRINAEEIEARERKRRARRSRRYSSPRPAGLGEGTGKSAAICAAICSRQALVRRIHYLRFVVRRDLELRLGRSHNIALDIAHAAER
ncbi:MAG: hypothetical protein NT062_06055 [Proteobacteria bacterium]|nr:hypothetical protein [Pseudomonadota bacterium]